MGFLKRSYAAVIFAFLYIPIFVLIVFSFNASKSRASWDGFTLRWYADLFDNSAILNALYYTLSIAVLAALLATIIGTLAAFAMYKDMRPWEKKIVMNLTYLPVLNPDIVTGISLMLLFIFMKINLGFLSLLLAHTIFNVPYVILTVLPKLRQFDNNLYEAALDLGASPAYAFRRIVFPEIMPGIVTGALFAFTLSIDDFVISFFTTGSGINNLSILIYSMARRGIHPTINALSTLLFLAVLILLLAVNRRVVRDKK
jgi:spermidine/putrescine transport system permease protein